MEASDDGGSNGSLNVCFFLGDIEVCVVIGVRWFRAVGADISFSHAEVSCVSISIRGHCGKWAQ